MDATNRVFQGQEGTGDAYIYKGMDDNSLALVDKIFNISGKPTKTAKAGSGATTKKTAQASDLKGDFYYKWASELQPKLNQLEDIGVQFSVKGIDVNDPTNADVFTNFKKAEREILEDKNLTDQLGKYYDEVRKQINQGDKKYASDSTKEIESFFERPLETIKADLKAGVPLPTLKEDTSYDDIEFIGKLKNAIPVQQRSSKGDYQGKIVVTETAQRERTPVDSAIEVEYMNNTGFKEAHDLLYSKLSPGKKAGYEELALKQGKTPELLFAQDVKYGQVQGKTINEVLVSKDKDKYYWNSGEGKEKVTKRTSEINTILKGAKQTDAKGKPTSEQGTLATRKLNSIFQGREINGVLVNNVKIIDGVVIVEGTYNDPLTRQRQEQEIEIFNLNTDEERGAQAINAMMNNNGWEEIENDYIIQEYKKTPAVNTTFNITPTKKKGQQKPAQTTTTSTLQMLEED